ncbi:MAG: hypothetical protein BWZ03_00199 [bacterium ADurb.BinA186]|nr:MAG: hypothetical protein BWZ03_00199 [bacterium ADurb.BinA186]
MRKKDMTWPQISIRVHPELRDKIISFSEAEKMTQAEFCRLAIEEKIYQLEDEVKNEESL